MSAEPVAVPAEDVRVGDLVWFLGTAHLVSEILEHHADGWIEPPCEWRTAREAATGWTITLLPGERIEVLR